MWCDARAFEDALDGGHPAQGLSLYRGDLLDGFHVDGAPEFEHWVERERARLRGRAADAAWALAEQSARERDAVEAARWARYAVELLPADEAVARRQMQFLRDLGDRAAAVRAYETFAETLTTDYELQPSAETVSLAAAIRLEEQPTRVLQLAPVVPGESRPTLRRDSVVGARGPRRGVLVTVMLVLAIGALGVSLRAGMNADSPRGPRLAVLPFENLGPEQDQYFADGMTEEVSNRLARVSGLLVTSRTTASQYARSGKSLRQFGEDLGVDYVLEGTVRSDRAASVGIAVRVAPRLVRIADEALVWSDQYTANTFPGEVFRVQADIAERVADALHITLRDSERVLLAKRPTSDPYAYDYYLRGRHYDRSGFDKTDNDLASDMYERAIAADSTFALAHARLARVHARAYWFYYDRTDTRIALAKQLAERAIALRPELPEAHLALGYYHYWGRLAYEDALTEFRTAQRLGLDGAELYLAIANVQRRQGAFDEAAANLESALLRDPHAANLPFELALTYTTQGLLERAAHYFDRAIQLNPQATRPYWQQARMYLGAHADTRKARAALGMPGAPAADSVIQFYLAWVDALEGRHSEALTRLRASTAPAIEYQWRYVPKAQLEAAIYARLGRGELARAYHDSARLVSSRYVLSKPTDANAHGALAIAYAGLGRRREAIDEARRAIELMPLSTDAWRGLYRLEDLARVHAMLGEYDAAFTQLEHVFALPAGSSLPLMDLGSPWDLLRDQQRYQALVRGRQ